MFRQFPWKTRSASVFAIPSVLCDHPPMLGESKRQFCLTRATRSSRGARKGKFLSVVHAAIAVSVHAAITLTAHAAITVDAYNPIDLSGSDGQALTAAMLNATSYHSATVPCIWGISGNAYVSTSYAMPIPGGVTVGATTYTNAGTRSFRHGNSENSTGTDASYVYADVGGAGASVQLSKITIACYFTQTETERKNWWRFDSICNRGGLWIALQTSAGSSAGKLYFNAHSANDSGASTFSPKIEVQAGKTYWVNLKFDGTAGMGCLAVFDPANHFVQVGPTVTCDSQHGKTISNRIGFGRVDGIKERGAFTGSTYYDHVMFDLNGTFPIIPGAVTNTAPPRLPVR
jgi:hypothetical protein